MPRRARVTSLVALILSLSACGGEEANPAQDTGQAPAPIPPGTDVWLARLSVDADGAFTLSDLENVTNRPGYDNQPAFLADGSAFYFTASDDAGEADIWSYALDGGGVHPVTNTAPESEYSATPLFSGTGFSAIRVEADSVQRLWQFDADGSGASVLFPEIAPVGYHAWVSPETAVLFVLGDPATLQVAHAGTPLGTTVASDIGRSIQRIPGTTAVSYVQRREGGASEIRRLDPDSGASELIIAGIDGGDFHAWTPHGMLLQASGGRLYAFRPGSDAEWREVVDLSERGLTLSRIAVHPSGTWIALVAEASE